MSESTTIGSHQDSDGSMDEEAQAGVTKGMVATGISTEKIDSMLSEESSGSEYGGFTERDYYNLNLIGAEDAQNLIDLFRHKQAEDPLFFYAIQVDQENRMTNFFWTDGRSRMDYEIFGDVVVFDTTFQTNNYSLKCAPFVGVNHHWSNILFGCAFMLEENIESYTWLFQTFLEAMGDQKPKVIFTDEDAAMASAIQTVLPETCHRLCLWHNVENAKKHLGCCMDYSDFKDLFNKCFWGCQSESELKSSWDEMLDGFDLRGNSWLDGKWAQREKWSPVYSMDLFSCRIRITQRSESTNNVFKGLCKNTLTLTQFVIFYEKQANEMRVNELREDYQCGTAQHPSLAKCCSMLKHAGNVYTLKIYKKFEEELIASLFVTYPEAVLYGACQIFHVNQEEDHNRVYTVRYVPTDCTISCSCKMFESMGLLCRHALRILNVKNVETIPEKYILRRWMKCAKKVVVNTNVHAPEMTKAFSSITTRNNLMRRAYNAICKGSEEENCSKVLALKITEMEKLVDSAYRWSKLVEDSNRDDIVNDAPPTLSPPCDWPKGMSNARMKSKMEKRKWKPYVKKNQQNGIPTCNAPPHQFYYPCNPELIPIWAPGYSNYGFTGIPGQSFTSTLQGVGLQPQNFSQGARPSQLQLNSQNTRGVFTTSHFPGQYCNPNISQSSSTGFASSDHEATD